MSGKRLQAMADGLVEETLVEAATTFFGARKALEHEIEIYHDRCEELEQVEEQVLRRAAALHALLPGPDGVSEFYAALGVQPGHLADALEVAEPDRSGISPGFAFTACGRYAKMVLAVYAALADAADAYLHGRHYDGEGGRKMMTPNYNQMGQWCRDINRKVEALNRNHSPSGALCFIKGLDPTQVERSRLSEATLDNYADELDRELAFKPVECLAMNLLAAPDLPKAHEAKSKVLAWARGACRRDPARAGAALADWKRAAKEGQ